MADQENPFNEIRADERISKYNSTVRKSKFKIDPTIHDEIRKYIIFAKPGRKPFSPDTAEDLKRLIEEMNETQAYRDRLSNIIIEAKIRIDELEILRRSGEARMYAEYGDAMKRCSNKETREATISYVLGAIVRTQEQWKSIRDLAEIARQNLNETYYALREIGENARTILADRKVKRSFD